MNNEELIKEIANLVEETINLKAELKMAEHEIGNLEHGIHILSNFIDENHSNVITAYEVLDSEVGNLSELGN